MPAKEMINSENVRLFEGTADMLLPGAKLPRGMRGFTIVVPAGKEHEWKLDLLWRIAIFYAAAPSMIRRRAKVVKLVEAVLQAAKRPDPEFVNPPRKAAKRN